MLPEHLIVDEHHDKLNGQKIYLATTVGGDCFLGTAASPSIDFEHLTNAYEVFKQEVKCIADDYKPLTINTDGFKSTLKVMEHLFENTTLIRCFLHGILNIDKRATKQLQPYATVLLKKAWTAYKAENKQSFAQQMRRLEEWILLHLPDNPLKKAALKLCLKKEEYMTYYDQIDCRRTSNMLDRLMKTQKKN